MDGNAMQQGAHDEVDGTAADAAPSSPGPPRRRPQRRLPRGLFAVCALLAVGAIGLIVFRAFRPKPPHPLPPAELPVGKHTDLFGDPLPPGAIARLGSSRFRAGTGLGVAVSRDGARIASGSLHGRIAVFDTRTGKRTHLLEGHLARIANPDYEFDPEDWFEGRDRTQIMDELHALAFVDDDRAVLSFGATLRRTDLETGQGTIVAGPWRGRGAHSHAIAPDGRRVASIVQSGSLLRVFDVETGLPRLIGIPGAQGHRHLRFSSDGARLALAGSPTIGRTRRGPVPNSAAVLVDTATGETLARAGRQHGAVFGLAYDGDDTVWVGGQHGQFSAWSLSREEMLYGNVLQAAPTKAERPALPEFAPEPSVSPDGTTVAVLITERNRSRIDWTDAASGEVVRFSPVAGVGRGRIEFSPDGSLLVLRCWSGVIQVFDVATGASRLPDIGHIEGPGGIAVSPDGRLVASLSYAGDLRVWELATGRQLAQRQFDGSVRSLEFDASGQELHVIEQELFLGTSDHIVLRPTDADILERNRIEAPEGTTKVAATLSPRARRMLVVAHSGPRTPCTLQVRGISGADGVTLQGVPWNNMGHQWCADGATLITHDFRRLLSADDAAPPTRLRWRTRFQRAGVATSADGKLMVGIGGTGWSGRESWGYLEVFDREFGRVVGRLERRSPVPVQHGSFASVAVAPDGRFAAVGTAAGAWLLVRLPSAEIVASLRGHLGAVSAIAFTPKGDRVITGSADGTLLVWDVTRIAGN